MRPVVDLLRRSKLARWYFAALAQSSLGTGAAAVALLLVAYERFQSPWAIGLGAARGRGAGDGARPGVRRGRGPLVAARAA